VQLLGNGNVFVGWGEVPRVSEFHHSGRMVFDAVLGKDYQSYRAFRLPWSGRPAEAPAIAVGADGGAPTVYASWNGATGVHAWQLLAGNDSAGLTPVSSTPSRGFESALPAPPVGSQVAVRALDVYGRALGQSSLASVAS